MLLVEWLGWSLSARKKPAPRALPECAGVLTLRADGYTVPGYTFVYRVTAHRCDEKGRGLIKFKL